MRTRLRRSTRLRQVFLFVYSIEASYNFAWYTHEDKDTPNTGVNENVFYSIPGADIVDHCFTVAGRHFKVKTYPEKTMPERKPA